MMNIKMSIYVHNMYFTAPFSVLFHCQMYNVTYENENSNYIIEGYLFRDKWNDS